MGHRFRNFDQSIRLTTCAKEICDATASAARLVTGACKDKMPTEEEFGALSYAGCYVAVTVRCNAALNGGDTLEVNG